MACCLCCLFFSGQKAVSQTCVVSTVGLCDPAVDVSIETEVISESFNEPNGITTIETTTTIKTTTTIYQHLSVRHVYIVYSSSIVV